MGTTVRLFVYGTLLPAAVEAEGSGLWFPDAVRGRLFDLGAYPGLVDLDDPTAGWVDGCWRAVETGMLETRFDEYEGVAEGLFRRALTTTRDGHRAWIYAYNRPLGGWERGPLQSWDGRRGAWPSG